MGELREKAEAEIEKRREDDRYRRQQEQERDQQQHEDEAKPTAEWLTRWSGMPVSPHDLKRNEDFFPGHHAYKTWIITLDGFHLVIKQEKRQKPMLLEEHTPDYEFELYQRFDAEASETRPIKEPADLLADPPVAAP